MLGSLADSRQFLIYQSINICVSAGRQGIDSDFFAMCLGPAYLILQSIGIDKFSAVPGNELLRVHQQGPLAAASWRRAKRSGMPYGQTGLGFLPRPGRSPHVTRNRPSCRAHVPRRDGSAAKSKSTLFRMIEYKSRTVRVPGDTDQVQPDGTDHFRKELMLICPRFPLAHFAVSCPCLNMKVASFPNGRSKPTCPQSTPFVAGSPDTLRAAARMRRFVPDIRVLLAL